jgi:hypothetical protein
MLVNAALLFVQVLSPAQTVCAAVPAQQRRWPSMGAAAGWVQQRAADDTPGDVPRGAQLVHGIHQHADLLPVSLCLEQSVLAKHCQYCVVVFGGGGREGCRGCYSRLGSAGRSW